MVVAEDCLATCDGQAGRTHAATSWKKGITIDLAGRDEPALRDSSKYCAFLGHNLVTV